MKKQSTIRQRFELEGLEPYGGNLVRVGFFPSEDNTGIKFRTNHGEVEAKLEYASEYLCSVLLRNKNIGVLHVEHLLATLYAFGVDNAVVDVQRVPSASFHLLDKIGLATSLEVVPNFEGKTYSLCEKIENNLVEQNCPRNLLRLDEQIGNLEIDKLIFEPMHEEGMVIQAITKYPILGEQILCIKLNAENYKREISKSRPYSKHYIKMPERLAGVIASIANPSFGIGHGFDPKTNILLPITNKKEMDKLRTIYASGDEPVRHTIMDRLGAIALLPGRLNYIKVTAKFSGHANDIRVLNNVLPFLVSY